MNLESLHHDEALRLREFPVARNKIFLAHAGVCPLPSRVARAMQEYLDTAQTGEQESSFYLKQVSVTRRLAANLLGVDSGEIALVGPTSLGLSIIANGLDWRQGDELICYQDDYPANVYAWTQLRSRGVVIRYVKPAALGAILTGDISSLLGPRTRMVCLASVHFISGDRLDLEAIGELCRQSGVLFCVDGIQSVGALQTPLDKVSFLAADSHKWMLGPIAAGILYVRRELQEQLRPTVVGWANADCPDYVAADQLVFKPDASRYEAGSHNLVGIVGLRACLELLIELGVEKIEKRLVSNSRFLRTELADAGWRLLGSGDRLSGSVSFHGPEGGMGEVFNRLTGLGIVSSLRVDRTGRQYLRLSPHFYNTQAELEKTLDVIGKV